MLWSLRPSRETDTGFHYGADISILSQFADEAEVLFPPCTMLQVLHPDEVRASIAQERRTVIKASGDAVVTLMEGVDERDKAYLVVEVVPTFV